MKLVAYVLSLSGRAAPADKVAAGKARFVLCAACHGADGKGNQAIGAPNLTDDIWLYGGSTRRYARRSRTGATDRCRRINGWATTRSSCWRPMSTACRIRREYA